MSPSVVITGASGYIGSFISDHLEKTGCECIKVARSQMEGALVVTDYAHSPLADVLIYCSEQSYIQTNTIAQNNCIKDGIDRLDALLRKGYAKVIYLSSAAVYKGGPIILDEEGDTDLNNNYVKLKMHCEKLVGEYNGVSLRLSNIYGGVFKKQTLFDDIRGQILAGTDIMLNNLNAVRDYCHIYDLSELIRLIITDFRPGVYNACSGHSLSVREIAEIALTASKRYHLKLSSKSDLKDVQYLSSRKAQECFSWTPQITHHNGITELYRGLV